MAHWRDQINQYRVISDKEEVTIQQILSQHPFLIQVLREAFDKIQLYFPGSQVFLNTVNNPEASANHAGVSDNEELVVYISTTMPPQEAVEALEKFYDDWWISTSTHTKGMLSIGLECL